jgi:TolB protein
MRNLRRTWPAVAMVCCVGVGVVGAKQTQQPPQAGQAQVEKTPLEANPVGLFDGHTDVGNVDPTYAGSAEYDKSKGTYTVAGSGENIWFGTDAFQFVWKQASGDVTLTADIRFLGAGRNPHRKAVLMVRQNLEADSPYADVALHGVGLTSLQFRDAKGGDTHEVQAEVSAPKRVRIMKRGDSFTMWVAGTDGKFALEGTTGKIELKAPFYVGIGVCSHEKDVVEKAVFSKVELGLGSS